MIPSCQTRPNHHLGTKKKDTHAHKESLPWVSQTRPYNERKIRKKELKILKNACHTIIEAILQHATKNERESKPEIKTKRRNDDFYFP